MTMPTAQSPPQVIFDEADVEQQLEWHQHRIQSRLEEHQRRTISDLIRFHRSDLYDFSTVRVSGANFTQPQFFSELFSPLLGDGNKRSIMDIIKSSDQMYDRLAKLGTFSHLQVSLNLKPGSTDAIEALVKVVERGRFFLKTSTDVGNGEGALTGLVRARNYWGRAEVLEASVGLGNKTKASCQIRAEAPIWAARARCEFAANASERDLGAFASCSETAKGVAARLKTETHYGAHELSYELVSRTIGNLLPTASKSIENVATAGPNLKSALALSWIRDTRDQAVFPTRGSLLKLVQEYAGLCGQANYFKTTFQSGISRRILNSQTIISLGFQCGFALPISGEEIPFNDRFQLGGPTNVRMFQMNSLGPKDRNDFLGGEKYWAGGLSVLAPIPHKPQWPLKLHGFINAGCLFNKINKLQLSKPSIGVGIGLVGNIQDVRIEANVGMPLASNDGDGARRGLQVGLGIGFLS